MQNSCPYILNITNSACILFIEMHYSPNTNTIDARYLYSDNDDDIVGNDVVDKVQPRQ